MMLSPRLTTCKNCTTIELLLDKIDRKIFTHSKKMYNNLVFMLNKNIDGQDFSNLLHYKRILQYKMYNENYACEFCIEDILSRVNELTIGQIEDCLCEDNTTIESNFPLIYYASDGPILDVNNLIGLINPNIENIEVLYNNIEGNYIYLVFNSELTLIDRIYTETSPNNVISDWEHLADIELNGQIYKVIRPLYVMTQFTNFKHNFIFE